VGFLERRVYLITESTKMDQTKIYKYLAQEATEAEVKALFEWIDESPENRKVFIDYKKSWALSATSQNDPNQLWDKLNKSGLQKQKNNRFILSVIKYAAAAVIVFSLGIFANTLFDFTNSKSVYLAQTQFEVPLGQMSTVFLPDGTTVHLNSGSKLFYDSNFSTGNRQVKLEGEAFFQVHSDKKHPFVVNTTEDISLKVYGTSFNIQAYPNDEEINTTLVEGSLGIVNPAGEELTRLVPGENAQYLKAENRINLSEVNTSVFTSWQQGLVVFRDESLNDIALKIERWYNVEIIFENPELKNDVYNGTILKNKPIDQILEVFKLTSSLEYKIEYRTDKPTIIYWN
jgi:ferric-dicitrate binding protein FerR (iron transport regulator)